MVDKERAARAIRELLAAVGENPDRPGLQETPERVARMYEELFAGLERDPLEDVKLFGEGLPDELVVVRDIPFYSMCEHHLLPFYGQAHIAYLPRDGRILGLSKLARIVDTLARKPQLQERLTTEIADAVERAATPRGVAVVVVAEHLCMTMRGIKKPGAKTVTSRSIGELKTDAALRAEAAALLKPYTR